jgi:hypothetical protein
MTAAITHSTHLDARSTLCSAAQIIVGDADSLDRYIEESDAGGLRSGWIAMVSHASQLGSRTGKNGQYPATCELRLMWKSAVRER